MKLGPRTFTAAVLAAIVLSACSSSKTNSATPAPPSSTTTPAPAASAGPGSVQELEALLVSEVPAGFVLQPDDVGDTGPSDLAKAVRDDPTPGAEQALRDEGFVQGYQRLWVGPRDAEIIVFLYQFDSAAGAEADFQRGNAALPDAAPAGATPFTVTGIPDGQSSGLAGSSVDFTAAVVLFNSGVFNVQIVCDGPTLSGLQSRASLIAKDQFDRL